MYTPIFLTTFLATTLAVPFASKYQQRTEGSSTWQPASSTQVICNTDSDKVIEFDVGAQLKTILNDACAAMMPPCAYPDRLPSDTFCIQIIDWQLDGPKNSTQSANVQSLKGYKVSGWDVQFSVTPAPQREDSAGVFWTVQDCYGYFAYMLEEWAPLGCRREEGSGVGNIIVGGESSLNGTVFEVSIVDKQSPIFLHKIVTGASD